MLFWLWSPAGSQAFDGIVFGLQLVADPLLWVRARGQPATDPVPTRVFRCGRRGGVLGVRAYPGAFCLCAQAAWLLIRVRAHPGFLVWAPGH